MPDETDHNLVRDLATLGRAVDPPASAERVAMAVMDRVRDLPSPARTTVGPVRGFLRKLESRRRSVALVVIAVLLVLLATPPVRATVLDWFGFGGVVVERGAPGPGHASPPQEVLGDESVTEAGDAVDFGLWVPTVIGPPDGVEVSPDRRIVSMSWSGGRDGVVRLDEFDGRIDFSFAKRTSDVTFVSVGETDGLWFEEPHEVVVLDPDGTRRRETARLAGHTLIWQEGVTTLRVEGDLTLERALEIAESATPVP